MQQQINPAPLPAPASVLSQGRPQRDAYDAIVIGAGHNGLTCAAYLARAGWRVLVAERRAVVGGAAVTEEVAPGRRVSSCSYIASMFLPRVMRDLDLAGEGLRMVACDPGFTVAFEDGRRLRWWADPQRTAGEIALVSRRDAEAFLLVDQRLKRLARYLQPFFLEPPPDIAASGLNRLEAGLRLARRFYGVTGAETAEMMEFLTGSLGEFLDREFEAEETKRLFLANNVYGKHGGPYDAGTSLGLLFHLLGSGEAGVQGASGHVIGGMGAITQALARACLRHGAEICVEAPVAEILLRGGMACGVRLGSGAVASAPVVISNADPKRTFLTLLPPEAMPAEFRARIKALKMNGPAGKLNLALSGAPAFRHLRPEDTPAERAVFTDVPSLAEAQAIADAAKRGEVADRLWIDLVTPSEVDPTLAPPGAHVMTCFVQYLPYRLKAGSWAERREALGDQLVRQLSAHAPNLADLIEARVVLTPHDLEEIYGLTEGNIFHGDLSLNQLFFMRPAPGASQYATPVANLWLCGAGAHPGGGVTGAPGHNAAKAVLKHHRGAPPKGPFG